MKTAIVFLILAFIIIGGTYYFYLKLGGIPFEVLVNQAMGLEGGEEEAGGLPIVVGLAPYLLVIAVLLSVGAVLYFKSKKHA